MEESTQYFSKESFSSIYPVLSTLIEERLIMQHEDVSKSERRRSVYELTEEGRQELKEWINKPVECEQFRNELLLKLFFGEIVPPSETRQHVEEFYRTLVDKDKLYNTIRDKLQLEHKNEPGLPYWLMTLDFGLCQVKAAREWCANTLKQYKKLEKG